MVPFGGWDMPVEYSGITAEHQAVRTAAGLFDVSHMGQIELAGPNALAAVQHLTSNDAAKLHIGQAQYSALTTPVGTFVDDVLVYRMGPNHFLLVVNASNIEKDHAWIVEHATAAGEVAIVNASDRYALIAVQGPKARTIAPALWAALLDAGTSHGLMPCGLGARDTLRLEAAMRVYGNDMDDTTTVVECDLGWIVGWNKPAFLGHEVLRQQKAEGPARIIVGFEMLAERSIARHGYPVRHDGVEVGQVTSGTQTPFLKKAIGMAYVPVALAAPGTELDIDVRGRAAKARVVPLPFYKRPKPA
jgi:aminomethyltransferase